MAPHGVQRPYITYFTFGAKAINYIDNAEPDSENAAVQIAVWSERQTEADALMSSIESALRVADTLLCRPSTGRIDAPYEPDTGLCGSIQRFDIWASK